jgi:predicted nucleic acid-binding protein
VIILDSNLWVFGLLGQNARASTILDEIQRGETVSAISAYMVQEVLNAFGRTPQLSAAQTDGVPARGRIVFARLLPSDERLFEMLAGCLEQRVEFSEIDQNRIGNRQ